jgi:hypothetical protein
MQMELALNVPIASRIAGSKTRRLTKARWWFKQMHEIVDRAHEWDAKDGTSCVTKRYAK